MLKPLLASAALGALLATGALAQTAQEPATPATEPAPMGATTPAAPAEVTGDWVVDENYQPVDVAQLTAEEITGADIRNPDGEVVATVDDIVLGADGKIESVAAKFGGFLGFGTNTVLLTLDEVEFMRNDSDQIVLRTSLTPDSLEGRPDYEG
jgi:hypothetical protein